MPDRGRRVLVTGATGFVGANLVRALVERGAHVGAVVRPGGSRDRIARHESELELFAADVGVPGDLDTAVERFRPEFAVNLAMTAGYPDTAAQRLEQLEVSVLGTARLVEALAAVGGCERLVHVGSSLEYGPKAAPMREQDVLAPIIPRGAAKAAATLVCLVWARMLAVPAVVLRPFTVYGPFEASGLVPSALRAALAGGELPLTEPGVVRDFVYVGDVVDAILRAFDAPALDGEILNVGSGRQTTIEELVEAVRRVTGGELRVQPGAYPLLPHDTRQWAADLGRTRRVLGWTPATDLDEGLRQTLAWLETHTP